MLFIDRANVMRYNLEYVNATQHKRKLSNAIKANENAMYGKRRVSIEFFVRQRVIAVRKIDCMTKVLRNHMKYIHKRRVLCVCE